MRTISIALPLLVTAMLLGACGRLHTTVVTEPTSAVTGLKKIGVAPVTVTSKEQNPDARQFNDQWKRMAADEIQSMLSAKGARGSGGGTVECKIHVVYGSRALRYFIGFGAGSGAVEIDLALKDAGGRVVYATRSEADLGGGGFGGDMPATVRKAIAGAVKDFGSRL